MKNIFCKKTQSQEIKLSISKIMQKKKTIKMKMKTLNLLNQFLNYNVNKI